MHAAMRKIFDIVQADSIDDEIQRFARMEAVKELINYIELINFNVDSPKFNSDYKELIDEASRIPRMYSISPLAEEKKIDKESLDAEGFTILMRAVMNDRRDIVDLLIVKLKWSDLNRQNHNGVTALMVAANCDRTEVAQQLIIAGANIYLSDSEGRAALDYALHKKNFFLVCLLLNKGEQIRNAQRFLDCLNRSDQRDSYVLEGFRMLYKCQRDLRTEEIARAEEGLWLNEENYAYIQEVLPQLERFHLKLRNQAKVLVGKAAKKIPGEILNLIDGYCGPLEVDKKQLPQKTIFHPAELKEAIRSPQDRFKEVIQEINKTLNPNASRVGFGGCYRVRLFSSAERRLCENLICEVAKIKHHLAGKGTFDDDAFEQAMKVLCETLSILNRGAGPEFVMRASLLLRKWELESQERAQSYFYRLKHI